MTPRQPKSLIWSFGIPLIIIEMIVGVGMSIFLASQSSELLTNRAMNQMDGILGLVLEQVRKGEPASSLVMPGEYRLTLISRDGNVLSDSDFDIENMDNNLLFRPEVQMAIRSGTGQSNRYSRTLDRDLLFVAGTVTTPQGSELIVRIALDKESIALPASGYMLIVLALTAAIMILTFVLLYFMYSRLRFESGEISKLLRRIGSNSTLDDSSRSLSRRVSSELVRLFVRVQRSREAFQEQLDSAEQAQSETQGILASMNNGVIALGTDLRVLTMNPAATRIFGLLGRDIRGRLLEEIVRDPALLDAIREGIDDGKMLFRELELESLGGRTMEVAIEPLYASAGMLMSGVLVILNETTRLRKLERIRKDFAANVSHELRTPLTAIRGYIELLHESVKDEAGRERLKVVERNSARLNAIIEDLLTLSRLESDDEHSMQLHFEQIRIEDLMMEAALLVKDRSEQVGVRIRTEVEPGIQIEGNRHLIDQGMINLLENAIRYSEPDSEITLIGRRRESGDIEIAVRDTGAGIPAEHLSRLFERFYRVDSGRSREQGGTGLGLSIVKHIALIHGGQVGVESQVGVGSTFFLTIPEYPSS
ncbi:MAG: hypothetical protein CMJ29_01460 [Phycisphaerae bacterium]|nr:hypothetical protein [Phycisphaerae bacterium]